MNQQLVKTLLVEIDASTEKLRRALREGGVELDTFAQKSTKASGTSSTAAAGVADKHAAAARQIAMVTETVARQGQVSGEAAKQLIAQAANVAFAFGPQGAIVGAIGIATLAIGTMFARARREMEETEARGREMLRRFSEMDVSGQAMAIQQLYRGDAFASQETLGSISSLPDAERKGRLLARGTENLTRDIAELETALANLGAAGPEGQSARALFDRFGWEYFQSEGTPILREAKAALEELNGAIARQTPIMQANAKAAADRAIFMAQNEAATKSTTEATKEAERERRQAEEQAERARVQRLERAAEAQIAWSDRLRTTLRDGFQGTAEDVRKAFWEMEAFARESGREGDIPLLREARDRALELIQALEESEQLLAAIGAREFGERVAKSDAVTLAGPAASEAAALRAQRERWRAIAADAARSDAERKAALNQAIQLQAVLEGLVEKEVGARKRATEALIAQAQVVGQVLDGVLQMVGAWGNVRREVIDTLRGIVQIGANVPNLLAQLDRLEQARSGTLKDSAGNLISAGAAAAGVASAAVPIIGALATIGAQLFGDSPAEQERKRVQRENTRAIERLTKQMSVRIDVSGTDFTAAARQVTAVLDFAPNGDQRWAARNWAARERVQRAQIEGGGADMEFLRRVAAELGVTLDGTAGSFRALEDAIAAARAKLFEFGDTYADQVAYTELLLDAKQISDPIERAMARLGPALAKSPLLQQVMAGADLSTEAGRQALRDAIVGLVETMQAGGSALDPEMVGLDFDEFLQVIQQLLGSLDEIEGAQPQATSSLGGVSGFRGLTEAAGERMADYLRGIEASGRTAEQQRAEIIDLLRQGREQGGEPSTLPSPTVVIDTDSGARVADALRAILGQGSDHLQVLRAQLAELARIAATPFTLPVIPGVTVPMRSSGGQTFAAGAVQVSIGDVVVQVSGSTTDPAGLGLEISRAVRDQVEEVLYRSVTRALRVRGDVSVIPGVR